MQQIKNQHIGDTIRIRRPPKVYTTELGRSIWMSDIEPCTLELETRVFTNPYDNNPAGISERKTPRVR
jgi:hypothetical protein